MKCPDRHIERKREIYLSLQKLSFGYGFEYSFYAVRELDCVIVKNEIMNSFALVGKLPQKIK